MIRTLIVDDHGIVREGLERLLETMDDITVVGSVSTGDLAVNASQALRPDLVLMDLDMPGGLDGVEATRAIVAADPDAKVLILTSFSDRNRVLCAVDAGAVGYVLKDSPAEELIRAVRSATRGEFPIDPKVARALFTGKKDRSPLDGMSAREIEVLGLVGDGMPNKEIARRLQITERTVKGHLTSVFRHIGVTDRTQAALWAERHGVHAPPDR
jgi:DNA-binding NarL/FixJ family response regulator